MNSPFQLLSQAAWLTANDAAFAIYDSFPVTPGHALVVTRRVVATWFDATAAEQVALMSLVNDLKAILDERLNPKPDGYNVGFNAGEAAGQTVPHLHIHVIPRYKGDVADPRGGIRHVIPGNGNYLAGDITSAETEVGLEPQTVRRRFMDFCRDMDMSSSYKPVFLLAMLDSVDETGTASIQKVLKSFRDFYENRAKDGFDAERGNNRLRRIAELDDSTVRRTMLESPYEKFERRSFIKYARDLAFLRFDGHLWRQLIDNDKTHVRSFCDEAITKYFDRE